MTALYIPLNRFGGLRPVGAPLEPGSDTYAAVIDGLPGGPPLAHWRLGESIGPTMFDRKAGIRHGTYFGALGFGAASLPQNSNKAVDFDAAGYSEVPHDSALALSAFSLSFWFMLNSFPFGDEDPAAADRFVLLSKGQVGSFSGDLDIWVDVAGIVTVQFQTASAPVPLGVGLITDGVPYHLLVRADNTGFDAALNGIFVAKNANYTAAWINNAQPFRLSTAVWHFLTGGSWPQNAFFADAVIDEVAIYDRVVTNLEALTLAQYNSPPVANADSFTVQPSSANVLNVTQNDTYQGAKAALGVQITAQPPHGTAAVRSDRDIDFTAGPTEQTASFSYRITDGFGTSAPVAASVAIQATPPPGEGGDDGQGGTLVYQWAPLASWIDGVPLSQRGQAQVFDLARWTDPAAAAGSSRLPTSITVGGGGFTREVIYNRAPDGSPAIEIYTNQGANSGGFTCWLRLFPESALNNGNPRHLRMVIEAWMSTPGDPTTYRSQGQGSTTGPYPSWASAAHSGGGKLFGMRCDSGWASCQTNWCQKPTLPGGDAGGDFRVGMSSYLNASNQFQGGGWCSLDINWNRRRQCELGNLNGEGVTYGRYYTDADHGVWDRHELEVRICSPSVVPANAIRGNTGFPVTSGTAGETAHGDGFSKAWISRNLNGTSGKTYGQTGRKLLNHWQGMVSFPRTDNNYQDVGLTKMLFSLWFGGTGGSTVTSNPCYTWIRKVEVYHYTQDDI